MMKTSELTGAALDWAVAKCEGFDPGFEYTLNDAIVLLGLNPYDPSTNWAHGGPIIERENLELVPLCPGTWRAISMGRKWFDGRTPLEAALRCYVASKLGDEVDVPGGLQ
jgi:hypothetical protein